MEIKETKKTYLEPQILLFALQTESPVLAGSPPVGFQVSVVPPTEDDDDTELIPSNPQLSP